MSDREAPFDYWVRLQSKAQGYNGLFNSNGQEDKRTVEGSTIREWATSMEKRLGYKVSEIARAEEEPPDFTVEISGTTLAVELTQMDNPEHRKRAAKGESPFAGQLFLDMQFDRERLTEEVLRAFQRKDKDYSSRGHCIDLLLIHTDEPWLTAAQLRDWLPLDWTCRNSPIRAVHLMLTYSPSEGPTWPLFEVSGSIAALLDQG